MMVRTGSLAAALGMVVILAGTPAEGTMPPRSGAIPPEVARAMHGGLLGSAAPLSRSALGALPEAGSAAAPRVWRVPVILVSYSDSALVYPAATFQSALFDTTGSSPTGSVYDYYL